MRRLALLVAVLFCALLGAGLQPGPGRPDGEKKRTPTPTPTPEFEASEEVVPTPTPEPPRFLAALDSKQGDGGERVAVFADGALVRTVTWRSRTVTKRLQLSREELDIVRRVLGEALASADQMPPAGGVLSNASERRMTMEIAPEIGAGPPLVLRFDDTTSLPLAFGRARGALEDLRSRFQSKSPVGDPGWDPGDVATGDRLRRKSDGIFFLVVRDDTFEKNLELRSEDGQLVLWVARDQMPKLFHDPALPSPDPAPAEPPR